MYIAWKYDFLLVLFWTRRFQPAEFKYAVFWGVTNIRIEKLVVAKLEKPENLRGITGPGTGVGPSKVALLLSRGQRNALAG